MALNNIYGTEGRTSAEGITTLLDAWQLWLRQTDDLSEMELLTMSLRWLEEFDASDIGWRPKKKELFTFCSERIREAAHFFLRTHQALLPEIVNISEIRILREGKNSAPEMKKPMRMRRLSSQPIYVGHVGTYMGGNFISIPDEFMGNREDYWPYPKER